MDKWSARVLLTKIVFFVMALLIALETEAKYYIWGPFKVVGDTSGSSVYI